MAKLYLDRSNCQTNRTARVVVPEGEWKTSVPRIELVAGRILGSSDTYACANPLHLYQMDAAQLREMAAAFTLAADWLEGKAEAPEVVAIQERAAAEQRRYEEEKAERERRLEAEGVAIRCTRCGKERRVLPEQVADWLRSQPCCCRKRDRKHEIVPTPCETT